MLCDDIRFENNGKLMLIGVYSDVVQVFKLPLQLRSLGLAVRAKALSQGRIAFNVTATDPQGNNLLEANGEMNYEGEPGRTIWLPIVMGPTLLTTEGPVRDPNRPGRRASRSTRPSSSRRRRCRRRQSRACAPTEASVRSY